MSGAEQKFMSAKEFRDGGYLLEANRRFFHPLGLALSMAFDPESSESKGVILGVLDSRDDPEGMAYAEIDERDHALAERIRAIEEERKGPREQALGYWIQPA